jgi:hypothetical protein
VCFHGKCNLDYGDRKEGKTAPFLLVLPNKPSFAKTTIKWRKEAGIISPYFNLHQNGSKATEIHLSKNGVR